MRLPMPRGDAKLLSAELRWSITQPPPRPRLTGKGLCFPSLFIFLCLMLGNLFAIIINYDHYSLDNLGGNSFNRPLGYFCFQPACDLAEPGAGSVVRH